MAARAAGAGHWHIITRHLLPGCYSHIIVISTLAIPGMILGETALELPGAWNPSAHDQLGGTAQRRSTRDSPHQLPLACCSRRFRL